LPLLDPDSEAGSGSDPEKKAGFTEEYVLQEPEPESSSSEEEDSTESEEEEDEESEVVAQNVAPKNEDSQNSGVTTVQPLQDMTEEQENFPKAHQAMNAANKVQLSGPDAAVAKTAVRQRVELSQRVGKAVAVLCRLCADILEAGRATAGLYGDTAAGQYGTRRQGSTRPQEPAEAERVARRGREFDARLARGLYQVPGHEPRLRSAHPTTWYRYTLKKRLVTWSKICVIRTNDADNRHRFRSIWVVRVLQIVF
jgi:hypothetical protein